MQNFRIIFQYLWTTWKILSDCKNERRFRRWFQRGLRKSWKKLRFHKKILNILKGDTVGVRMQFPVTKLIILFSFIFLRIEKDRHYWKMLQALKSVYSLAPEICHCNYKPHSYITKHHEVCGVRQMFLHIFP